MASSNSLKVAGSVAIVLLVGAIVYLAIEMGRNGRLESSLNAEKLASETLLSEKLALQKEINQFREDIKLLEGRNEEFDRILKSTTRKLEEEEKELARTKKQASSAAQLKKQYQDLQKLKQDLELEASRYNSSLEELRIANRDMNNEMAVLKQQNSALKDELNRRQFASLNDVMVEPVKKSNRLTVKASRTRKIIVHADVPSENISEDMTLKIIAPGAKELAIKKGEITVKKEAASNKEQSFYDATVSPGLTYKSVEIAYESKGKLVPGVYKISVLSNGKSIGSLQVRLR